MTKEEACQKILNLPLFDDSAKNSQILTTKQRRMSKVIKMNESVKIAQAEIKSTSKMKLNSELSMKRDSDISYRAQRDCTTKKSSSSLQSNIDALQYNSSSSDDAEEVDALKQRLQIAELVMRKLYKRTIQLENQISNTRNHTDDQRLTTSTTDEKKPDYSHVKIEKEDASLQEDKYLAFIAQEQDKTIQILRAELNQEQARQPTQKKNLNSKTVKKNERLQAEALHHQQKYKRMKSDYYRLLNQRCDSISGNNDVAKNASTLIVHVRNRLLRVEREREIEHAILNQMIYKSEVDQCKELE